MEMQRETVTVQNNSYTKLTVLWETSIRCMIIMRNIIISALLTQYQSLIFCNVTPLVPINYSKGIPVFLNLVFYI